MIKGYQQPLFGRYSSQDIHRFRMNRRGRGRPPGRRGRAPPYRLGLGLSQRGTMVSGPNKISRSPTPPETDDDGEEWPVHGIVGEDVDVFGISRYAHPSLLHYRKAQTSVAQLRGKLTPLFLSFTLTYDLSTVHKVRWQNWSRPDGTNTTWMRDIEGDPAFVVSWNEAMKHQRLDKASESQPIDIVQLASIPMHDRLTFERAQAVEEKMAERLQKGAPKVYKGWMAEIERQVPYRPRRGEKSSSSSTVPKKRSREPSLRRYVLCTLELTPFALTLKNCLCSYSSARDLSHAESSRSAASQKRPISVSWDIVGEETSTASDGDFGSDADT
jgi:hypothetical protein